VNTIADRVRVVLEEISVGVVTEDRKVDELGLDSLDFVSLQHDLEDEFKVKLPIEELAVCETVGDITKLIKAKCYRTN
jgi:acyl carrier protein